jgi:hypothetical protein
MTTDDDWSPDEPLGTEAFEQGDESFDDKDQLDPDFLESVELDPSLDPTLTADDREIEEAGVEFDDPEALTVLDGIGGPTPRELSRAGDTEGWDLDAPEVPGSREVADDDV